jgi:TRAP-type C4-dicarboxylate transport system substrate-binding protein
MKRLDQAMVAIAMTSTVVLSAAGCTDEPSSKAGGSSPPVTLRIGTNDEPGAPAARAIEEFARQVTARSHGQIRIEPVWEAAAGMSVAAGWDQVVARQVVDGRLDMGMIPARAWDTEKVTSLRALQAPFLVNSDALVKQVVTADMAGEMLAGLDRAGVTGLALVPESTRQIFGFGKPLLSPADLKGKTVRVPRSDTSYALFRALGATPNDDDALRGRFVGAESSFELARNLQETTITATGNLTLFSKVNSVVINSKRFAALDEARRVMLRDAAVATRDWGAHAMPTTADEAKRHCRDGHTVVLATPADLAAFQRAAQTVYADLEKDAQTKAFIAGIRGLASRTPPPPPIAACGPAATATPSLQPAAGAFPDGVYRKTVSEQAMLAAGVSGRDAKDHAGLWTMTFAKGVFTIQQRGYPAGPGVYCLSNGTITVAEGRTRCGGTDGHVIFTATWQLDNDQLRFTPTAGDNDAPPSRLTNALFGGEPWTKIG